MLFNRREKLNTYTIDLFIVLRKSIFHLIIEENKEMKKNILVKNIFSKIIKKIAEYIRLVLRPDSERIASHTINLGLMILGIFLSIFTIWGIVAPIESASIANGKVVLDFNKKTVQHLEGGIIDNILVKEGQEVTINQPLIYLQDVQARSQNKMLKKQYITQTNRKSEI